MTTSELPLTVSVATATEGEAADIAGLHARVAASLTLAHGRGHWSSPHSKRTVLRGIRTSRVFVGRTGDHIAGTFRLATKKPWAIDLAYFTPVKRASYLHDMAVEPTLQRKGIGRLLLRHAVRIAGALPSEAIRLDAYDAAAGAGDFYSRCGFKNVGRRTYRNTPLVYFELLLQQRSV